MHEFLDKRFSSMYNTKNRRVVKIKDERQICVNQDSLTLE